MKDVSVSAAKRLGITCCSSATTLDAAAQTMMEEDISCVVILDGDGNLQGIITRTDIVHAALEIGEAWREAQCKEWMTSDVITVTPETSLWTAAKILQSKHIHRVVVIDGEGERRTPIAVVSDSDIVYHLVDSKD